MPDQSLCPVRISIATIPRVLARGWADFAASRMVSVVFALVFALIGVVIIAAIEHLGVAPMLLPLAGGFMLVGPILLAGFFSLADRLEAGDLPRFGQVLDGFRTAPSGLWIVAAVCAMLFMIWVTDAATVYSFTVGGRPLPFLGLLPAREGVASFALWSSVMGAVIALVIFAISAFSVPLLHYRRATVVGAVSASARGVFANFPVMLPWAVLLAVAVMGSILFVPAFPVVFPVLAYASRALYQEVFPP